MIDTTPVTVVTADPLLRWTSIADHARTAHGARWASDDEAIRAIVGAFDAVLPTACGYNPSAGVIGISDSRTTPVLRGWDDVQMLACTVAALAAALPACDLQSLFQTENLVA